MAGSTTIAVPVSGGASTARVASAASANNTSVKAVPTKLIGWVLTNGAAAAKYVRVYDLAVAPNPASHTPKMTLILPAGGMLAVNMGEEGIDLVNGFGYNITGAVGDTDTTAVAANDVHGAFIYR